MRISMILFTCPQDATHHRVLINNVNEAFGPILQVPIDGKHRECGELLRPVSKAVAVDTNEHPINKHKILCCTFLSARAEKLPFLVG